MLQRVRDGHLLGLFGVWRIAGFFVLAMELADGTLMDRLNACRKKGLPGVPRLNLLGWFEQAARGIDFLNEPQHILVEGGRPAGIQHGDVKPQNLLLVGSLCKVGDFGLLRQLAATASQKTNSMSAAYAPPEIFNGRSSTRSDQYSLAVSWCQLRGGRLPFEGPPVQVMAGHLMRPPDLTMLPKAEQAAVGRALSKKPQERWPSCREFVEGLRTSSAGAVPGPVDSGEPFPPTISSSHTPTLVPGRGAPRPPREGRRRRPLLWLLPVLLLGGFAAFIGLGGLFSGDRGKDRQGAGPVAPKERDPRPGDKPLPRDGGNVRPPEPRGGEGPQQGQPFTNSVGMKFAWIKPGNFLMGSPDGTMPPGVPAEEQRFKNETPHRVTLTKGYHLGVYLVTQQQWEEIMGKDANHSTFKGQDEDEKKKLPVDNVTWFDCVELCIKLSEQEKRKPHYRLANESRNEDGSIKAADVEVLASGTGYRLPTEAEWEYACRAGTDTPFWWGTTITTDQANYDGNSTYGKDGKKGVFRKKTTPVDFFPPNKWGLHDMHGNLNQWCQDWYGERLKDDIKDPVETNTGAARVLRGGSWLGSPRYCRAASRGRNAPGRINGVSCRLALLLD